VGPRGAGSGQVRSSLPLADSLGTFASLSASKGVRATRKQAGKAPRKVPSSTPMACPLGEAALL